jgi:hypothetical protein
MFFALPVGLVVAEKYLLAQKHGAMYEFAHHRKSSTMEEGYILTHFLYFVLTMSCVLSVCVLAFCAPEHPEWIREMGRNTKEAYVLHATFFLPAIAALDLSSFLKAYEPLTIILITYTMAVLVSMLTGSAFSKRIFDWLCSPWWLMQINFAELSKQAVMDKLRGKHTNSYNDDEEKEGLI